MPDPKLPRQNLTIRTYDFPDNFRGKSFWRSLKHSLARLMPERLYNALHPFYLAVAETVKPPYQIKHLTRSVERPSPAGEHLVNLWHDWPQFRRLEARLDAFSQLAIDNRADILLLQEVASTARVHSLERLAYNLKMDYVYTRANGSTRIGFEEGLAIFSRYPIANPILRRLGGPAAALEHRMALGAQVRTPWGNLTAFTAHLGLGRLQNERQIADLRRWVSDSLAGRPAIVGGDFNAPEHRSEIRETSRCWIDTFRYSNPVRVSPTHTLHWPWGGVLHRARLDYLFLIPGPPGWYVADADHTITPQRPHSDHCAVIARLLPV